MAAFTARVGSSHPSDLEPKTNALSVASVVLAGMAMVGFVFEGAAVLAVFAVGAGHMALQQIKVRGERGTGLAYLSLGVSYAMAAYALISSIYFAFVLSQQ